MNRVFSSWITSGGQTISFPQSFLHVKMRKCQGCNEIKKKILGLLYLTHCTLREVSQNAGFLWSVFSRIWTQSYPIYMDTIVSDYRIVSYRIVSDSVHTRKKTDQRKPTFRDTSRTVKKKELYKIFDANSKMVIPYKWLLHSIFRICKIQRLSQFKVA